VRTILEVELFDVSPVTYPAYDDTEVGLRAGKLLVEAREKGIIRSAGLVKDVVSDLRSRMELDLRERQLPTAFRNI
nr:HK97 family phage prohead protease [Shewanella shenzhenensis]